MTDDIYSMTKTGFHEAMRLARSEVWDEAAVNLFVLRSIDADELRRMWAKNPYRKEGE